METQKIVLFLIDALIVLLVFAGIFTLLGLSKAYKSGGNEKKKRGARNASVFIGAVMILLSLAAITVGVIAMR